MADHNAIIATTARVVLGPLGFQIKGRSRIWLADRDYWLIVVEFQPSSWSKGSYLNVGAHWLWSPPNRDAEFVLSFDYGGRITSFIEFRDEEQFLLRATDTAKSAAAESERLIHELCTIHAISRVLVAKEQEAQKSGHGRHWGAYHAGVAAAIAGDLDVATEMFGSVLETTPSPNSILHPSAQEALGMMADIDDFRRQAILTVNQPRAFFKLPALEADPF
jgi:hypothetical protein